MADTRDPVSSTRLYLGNLPPTGMLDMSDFMDSAFRCSDALVDLFSVPSGALSGNSAPL